MRLTYAQLATLLHDYVAGFAGCAATGLHPTIAVATSNDGNWTPSTPGYYGSAAQRGQDWANEVVAPLRADATTTTLGATIVAAVDIEGAFASTEQQAADWETALRAATPGTTTALYYVGSADGCPKSWTRAVCGFGWTAQQYLALASGPRTLALPQIYLGYQATQWSELAASGPLRFAGLLTEHGRASGTLTPDQAYLALASGLASVGGSFVGAPLRPDLS